MEACDLASAGMNIPATVPLLQTAKVLHKTMHDRPLVRSAESLRISRARILGMGVERNRRILASAA